MESVVPLVEEANPVDSIPHFSHSKVIRTALFLLDMDLVFLSFGGEQGFLFVPVQTERVPLFVITYIILVSVDPIVLVLYIDIGTRSLLTNLSCSSGVLVDGCICIVTGVRGVIVVFLLLEFVRFHSVILFLIHIVFVLNKPYSCAF